MGAGSRAKIVAGLGAALMLFGAASASATVRYAAPGGAATPAACQDPTPGAPRCSIRDAAAGSGVGAADEVVIAPGNYSDADLGSAEVGLVAGNVHGPASGPRPVITVNGNLAAFNLNQPGEKLSDVEVISTTAANGIILQLGTVERVVVRSSAPGAIACRQFNGLLRDSACLTSGANATAVGNTHGGINTPQVRNVTAVSTGTGSNGIHVHSFAQATLATVRATIARGAGTDVKASRDLVAGTSASITMIDSNYATTDNQGGEATITSSGTQQTGVPQLAADGYHELPTSTSTIDLGSVDGSSGSTDVDGQARGGGVAYPADIGADQRGNPAATTLDCTPSSLLLGSSGTSCDVVVSDTAPPAFKIGLDSDDTVAFASSGAGSFSAPSCVLTPIGPSGFSADCPVAYTPSAPGTHTLSGAYGGDSHHEPSQGSAQLVVDAPPAAPAGAATTVTPAAKCKKGKKLKKVKRKRKCVKRKRKKKK